MKRICAVMVAVILSGCIAAAQNSSEGSEIISRVSAASVVVLSGEGAGRLNAISTGVVVRPNGVILTAYHSIKNAREVQVRLHSGDVYDQVVLIGTDERRDVAALKISARDLPTVPLGSAAEVKSGEPAYVVSNSNGLSWSASKGIFAASRMADEVPGAGNGYRVLQFTAPVSGGASGAPVVDARGNLVGIITGGMKSGDGFAVPIEAVIGLADGTGNLALGSGSALQMPVNRPTPSSAAVAASNPEEILRSAKTLHIETRTMYFTPETLEKELPKQKEFAKLALMIVKDARVADMLITIDRPLFTYTFTYSVTDLKTSIILDSGKVTAIDGNSAAGKIAKQLVTNWIKVRQARAASKSE
jgi:hypothetical protein